MKKKTKVKKVKKAKPAKKKVAKAPAKKAKPAKRPVVAKPAKPVKPAKATKSAKRAKAKQAEVVPDLPPRTLKLSEHVAAKYRMLLLNLRDHLIDGVSSLANEHLKRSSRDASGELSGYSMHMADAGTDNFDREFALSLVSNEQEALYEIEEAIKRLEQETYGICEICDKNIRKERLEAVPFTRHCVPCQASLEKNSRRPSPQGALFSESADDDGDEKEDSED